MQLQSQITREDYSKLMTAHLLKKPSMIIIVILGIASLIFYLQNPELGVFYLFLGIGFIGIPALTYFAMGQSYQRNKHFNEKLELLFDDDNLELIGQTFRSKFNWTQITRVKESAKYFSLHQGQVLLTLINKEDNNQEQVEQARQLFKAKQKLK